MSERINELAPQNTQAKQAVQSKRMSEWCERTSEWTSEWPNNYVPLLGCSAPLCIARWPIYIHVGRSCVADDFIIVINHPKMPIRCNLHRFFLRQKGGADGRTDKLLMSWKALWPYLETRSPLLTGDFIFMMDKVVKTAHQDGRWFHFHDTGTANKIRST